MLIGRETVTSQERKKRNRERKMPERLIRKGEKTRMIGRLGEKLRKM